MTADHPIAGAGRPQPDLRGAQVAGAQVAGAQVAGVRPPAADKVMRGLVTLAAWLTAVPAVIAMALVFAPGLNGYFMLLAFTPAVLLLVAVVTMAKRFRRTFGRDSEIRARFGRVPRRYHVLAGVWVGVVALAGVLLGLSRDHEIGWGVELAAAVVVVVMLLAVVVGVMYRKDGGGSGRTSLLFVQPWE